MNSPPRTKRSNGATESVRVMTGNEACAEAALAAGLTFFAGYPITPSSEIAEILSDALPRMGGKFLQMEDEIGAMAAILGASLAGSKTMTATSGPGFSLKQENIGYGCMAEIPCVIVNVMRGGPSTGLPTLPAQGDVMQARWGTHGDHPIIVLCPRGVRETYDLTVRAFNLAELFRTPVILLMDEVVAHVSERVTMPASVRIVERASPSLVRGKYLPYAQTDTDVPPFVSFGQGHRFHVTGLAHDETGFPTNQSAKIDKLLRRLDRKITRYADRIARTELQEDEGATVAVISYGSTARSAKEAIRRARKEGLRVTSLSLLTIWPFPAKPIRKLVETVRHIIVPELNLGQVAHEVEWAVAGKAEVHAMMKIDGEPIHPDEILEKIREVHANGRA